jgi:hypothetical protein
MNVKCNYKNEFINKIILIFFVCKIFVSTKKDDSFFLINIIFLFVLFVFVFLNKFVRSVDIERMWVILVPMSKSKKERKMWVDRQTRRHICRLICIRDSMPRLPL